MHGLSQGRLELHSAFLLLALQLAVVGQRQGAQTFFFQNMMVGSETHVFCINFALEKVYIIHIFLLISILLTIWLCALVGDSADAFSYYESQKYVFCFN